MALGDDALNAGMDIVLPTDDRRNGADEITRTRDYLAQKLAALGTAAQYDAVQSATPNTIPRRWADGTLTGPDPVSPGGYTPRQYVDAALAAATTAQRNYTDSATTAQRNYTDSKVGSVDLSSRVAKTGDTMSGHLFLPASSAATSGYTVAYINGDGRVSRGASSERYKENIEQIDPDELGGIFPDLYTFRMIGSDTPRVGWIAERLAENPDMLRFVVYQRTTVYDPDTDEFTTTIARDADGTPIPESIDFISLLIAQNAQLHQAVDLLTQRLTALEGTRHAAN